MKNYLKEQGKQLIEMGYYVIPIQDGMKQPNMKEWTKLGTNQTAQLDKWVNGTLGETRHGVGIMTGSHYDNVIGLDVDVYDEVLADKIETYLTSEFAGVAIRIGKHPKRMYVFKGDKKFKSHVYTHYTSNHITQQVELIADGKQFVAYAIHPDTKQPYEWVSPLQPAVELPILTQTVIDTVAGIFNQHFGIEQETQSTQQTSGNSDDFEYADFSMDDIPVREMTFEEFEEIIDLSKKLSADSSDSEWRDLGMVYWYHFDGSKEAFDRFIAYWEKTLDRKCSPEWRKKWKVRWKSFDPKTYNSQPITIATYVQAAKPALRKSHLKRLRECENVDDFMMVLSQIARVSYNAIEEDIFVGECLNTLRRLQNGESKHTKSTIHKMLHSLRVQQISKDEIPYFVQNFCYLAPKDTFISMDNQIEFPPQAYDKMFAKSVADLNVDKLTASQIAMRMGTMRTITGIAFNPTMGKFFNYDMFGVAQDLTDVDTNKDIRIKGNVTQVYLNTYAAGKHAEIPDEWDEDGIWARDAFIEYIEHLIPEKYVDLVTQWLAFNVQHQGKKRGYAFMLTGRQGDGKSNLAEVVSQAIGIEYCNKINNDMVQSRFNGVWLRNYLFTVVEEYEMTGDRGKFNYERMKDVINGERLSVEDKHQNATEIKSFANFMFLSNKDGLADDGDVPYFELDDRRFFYVQTRYSDFEEHAKFKRENPNFHDKMVEIKLNPNKYAKWVRKYLEEYPLTPEFLHNHNAPNTEYKMKALNLELDEDLEYLREYCETHELVNLTGLLRKLNIPVKDMKDNKWRKLLSKLGFHNTCRIKIGEKMDTVYSRNPDKWIKLGNKAVRDLLDSYEDSQSIDFDNYFDDKPTDDELDDL